MNIHTFAGVLSFALAMIAYGWILYEVNRGRAALAMSTWFVWSGVNILLWSAMIAQGIFSWQMTAYTVGTLIVTGFALRKGSWGWTKLDTVVVTLSILAMLGWYTTSEPNVAIVMSLAADTLGVIPMYVAMWKDHRSQSEAPWVVFWIVSVVGLFAVEHWTWAESMMPVWMAVLNGITFSLLLRGWHYTGTLRIRFR